MFHIEGGSSAATNRWSISGRHCNIGRCRKIQKQYNIHIFVIVESAFKEWHWRWQSSFRSNTMHKTSEPGHFLRSPALRLAFCKRHAMTRAIMRKIVVPAAMGLAVIFAQDTAFARYRPYVPEPGDNSLRSKCKSEASMMVATGKGADVAAERNRQMRKDYFRKCMQGQ